MTPTPPVTGDIAPRIEKELRNGTPNTPERVATIKRADEVFRRSTEQSLKRVANR